MIFEPGKGIHFSGYPSPTSIHLPHRFTRASKSFDCCLRHFRTSDLTSSSARRLSPRCKSLYVKKTSHRKHFFMKILCIESFCLHTKKTAQQNVAFEKHITRALSPFWLLKSVSEHAHAHLLPRLPWSWTVLLHSDAHRNPVTSITAVLLPFVAYLLTLPHISVQV
jgi:hypothetical protein